MSKTPEVNTWHCFNCAADWSYRLERCPGCDANREHIQPSSTRRAVEDAVREELVKSYQACPCLHTTPCQKNCTCVRPHMSHGCLRCCSYGSNEQQQRRAEWLAKAIDSARATP